MAWARSPLMVPPPLPPERLPPMETGPLAGGPSRWAGNEMILDGACQAGFLSFMSGMQKKTRAFLTNRRNNRDKAVGCYVARKKITVILTFRAQKRQMTSQNSSLIFH